MEYLNDNLKTIRLILRLPKHLFPLKVSKPLRTKQKLQCKQEEHTQKIKVNDIYVRIQTFSSGIYLFKISNRNTGTVFKIYPKLIMKTSLDFSLQSVINLLIFSVNKLSYNNTNELNQTCFNNPFIIWWSLLIIFLQRVVYSTQKTK